MSFGEEQVRQRLCDLGAEEARRKVAMLMVELSTMERMKAELQLLKTTSREQQRKLEEAATAAVAETPMLAKPPAVDLLNMECGRVDHLGTEQGAPQAAH